MLEVRQLGKLYVYFSRNTTAVEHETFDHLWQQEIGFDEL